MAITRIDPGPRMSKAVIHNGVIYISGQIPHNTVNEGLEAQTKEVLGLIEAILASAGSNKANLLSVSISLANIADFDAMNVIWEAWVDPDNKPARVTVGTALSSPEFKIEIGAIAAVAGSV